MDMLPDLLNKLISSTFYENILIPLLLASFISLVVRKIIKNLFAIILIFIFVTVITLKLQILI